MEGCSWELVAGHWSSSNRALAMRLMLYWCCVQLCSRHASNLVFRPSAVKNKILTPPSATAIRPAGSSRHQAGHPAQTVSAPPSVAKASLTKRGVEHQFVAQLFAPGGTASAVARASRRGTHGMVCMAACTRWSNGTSASPRAASRNVGHDAAAMSWLLWLRQAVELGLV